MPALAIDTATDICAIALGGGDRLIDEISVVAGRSHLEMLLPEIQTLLDRHGLKIADIDVLVAGTGPGTFTGLRVGVATARGLAQALEKPLYGSSTLGALAQGIFEGAGKDLLNQLVMPVIDAKRGQVFAQLFRAGEESEVLAASDILCLDPDELLSLLPGLTEKTVLAAGSGVLAYWTRFEVDARVEVPSPESPLHRVRAGFHLRDLGGGPYEPRRLQEVLPVYGREPDADKTVLFRKREPWLK